MTTASDTYRSLGDVAELDDFQVVPWYVDGVKKRVTVTRVDGALHALDDLCPEHGCPLSAGLMIDEITIMCQCGGCRFDVTTGAVVRGPATTPLRTYPVRENDGKVDAQAA
ncbi:Rieske (2Fe-2S) protein [Microbacterium sp.]|uniref:Rieske (2Fe-2S) protein n=1 Tax=Microbacterium sp. TaxID=51671 RepID=UPI003A88875C